MAYIEPELAGHPDRLRWNARYGGDFVPSFTVHPLAALALSEPLPAGQALELGCGPSGAALAAAAAGRRVTAVDASDVALALLGAEAARRGLAHRLVLVHADLAAWRPVTASFALVLCTGFWDRAVFARAAAAVAPGGLLAWEALTRDALRHRPGLSAQWCVRPGEPASLLPPGFEVLDASAVGLRPAREQLLARREPRHSAGS